MTIPRLYVSVWRAYRIGWCPGFATRCPSGSQGWCLVGNYGIHLHSLPPPPAKCFKSFAIPNVPPHEEAPFEGCICGYYGLFKPDPARVATGVAFVWMRCEARGVVFLHEDEDKPVGVRMECFEPVDMFWPPGGSIPWMPDFSALLPGDRYVSSPATPIKTLDEVLPPLAEAIGIPLRKESMRPYLDWGGWEYV